MEANRRGVTPAGTAYNLYGEGEPVVLIHGVGLDQSIWGGQCVALSQRYQVITYDMLGHGQSPAPAPQAELSAWVDQLVELIDSLGLDRVHLIGFSMGGLVARSFAVSHADRCSSLVVMSSVFDRSDSQRQAILGRTEEVRQFGPAVSIDAALDRWFSSEFRGANPAQVEAVRELVLSNDPASYLTSYCVFAKSDNYLAQQLAQLPVPTLVMTGELDPGSTPEMARKLAVLIPRARAEVLKGERHMMPMESPRRVNAVLEEFLGQHSFRETPKVEAYK